MTPGQLRELSKLDEETVARLAELDDDPDRAADPPGRFPEPAAES